MNQIETNMRVPEQTLLVFSRNPLDGKFFEHILVGHPFVRYGGQVNTRKQFDSYAATRTVSILFIETELYGSYYNLDHLRDIHNLFPNIFIISFSLDDRSNALLQTAMFYGAFAALLKPLIPQTIYRYLNRIGEQISIASNVSLLSRSAIVSEKLNYYADTIKNAEEEELNKLIIEMQQGIYDECGEDKGKARHYIRQQLHYLHNIFVNDLSHDSINTITNKYMERLKGCAGEEIGDVLSGFVHDCNYAFNYSRQGINRERVNFAKSLIRQYLENGRTVSLNSIAEALFISPFHLSRTFSKIEGVTFMEYLQSARLEYAKILLTTTDSSIETIAYRCGYNEVNSFRRMFRKELNLSPVAYRNQLKNQ